MSRLVVQNLLRNHILYGFVAHGMNYRKKLFAYFYDKFSGNFLS